ASARGTRAWRGVSADVVEDSEARDDVFCNDSSTGERGVRAHVTDLVCVFSEMHGSRICDWSRVRAQITPWHSMGVNESDKDEGSICNRSGLMYNRWCPIRLTWIRSDLLCRLCRRARTLGCGGPYFIELLQENAAAHRKQIAQHVTMLAAAEDHDPLARAFPGLADNIVGHDPIARMPFVLKKGELASQIAERREPGGQPRHELFPDVVFEADDPIKALRIDRLGAGAETEIVPASGRVVEERAENRRFRRRQLRLLLRGAPGIDPAVELLLAFEVLGFPIELIASLAIVRDHGNPQRVGGGVRRVVLIARKPAGNPLLLNGRLPANGWRELDQDGRGLQLDNQVAKNIDRVSRVLLMDAVESPKQDDLSRVRSFGRGRPAVPHQHQGAECAPVRGAQPPPDDPVCNPDHLVFSTMRRALNRNFHFGLPAPILTGRDRQGALLTNVVLG